MAMGILNGLAKTCGIGTKSAEDEQKRLNDKLKKIREDEAIIRGLCNNLKINLEGYNIGVDVECENNEAGEFKISPELDHTIGEFVSWLYDAGYDTGNGTQFPAPHEADVILMERIRYELLQLEDPIDFSGKPFGMLYLLYEEKAKSRTYGIGDEELSFDDYRMAVSEYYGKTNPIVQKMKETRENFNNLILEQGIIE